MLRGLQKIVQNGIGEESFTGSSPIFISLFFRLIRNFVYRIDRDERRRVGFPDVVHQSFILLFVHNRDDLAADNIIVGTCCIVKRGTAVKVVQDELRDFLHLRGENAHAAFQVQTEDKVIHDHTAEIGTDQADDDRLFVVTDRGRQRDDQSGNGHRLSEVHPEITVHDFCDNVQSSGRGIAREEERKTDADHKDIANHIQKRVAGEGLEIRKHDFKNTHDRGHEKRAVNGFRAEFGADQKKSDDKEDDVQQEGDRGDRQRNEIADDHRKGSAAADGDVTREHEEIHGGGDDGGAEGDDEKFADGAFVEHGVFLVRMEFFV